MTTMIAEELGRIPMSPFLTATLTRAADYATAQSHREVTLEHLLLALAEDPEASVVLKSSNIDIARLTSDVAGILSRSEDRVAPGTTQSVVISQNLKRILEAAAAAAQQGRRREINGAIVLAAIVGDGKSAAAHLLRAQGLTFEEAIRALQRASTIQTPSEPSAAPDATPPSGQGLTPMPTPGEASPRDQEQPKSAPGHSDKAIDSQFRKDADTGAAGAAEARGPQDKEAKPERPLFAIGPGAAKEAQSAPRTQTSDAAMLPSAGTGTIMSPLDVRHFPHATDKPPEPRKWAPPLKPSAPPAEPPSARPVQRPQRVGAADPRPPTLTPPPLPPSPYPSPQGAPPPRPYAPPPGHNAADPPFAGRAGHYRTERGPVDRGQTGSGPFMGSWPLIESGQLVENIPRRMRVGVPVVVEARIAKADVKALAEGLQGGGAAYRHEVMVTKAMSVRLRAPDGGFVIETRAPETQWIENVLGIASDDFASWRWTITARERGRRQLQLIVSARTVGVDGLTAETALPDQVIDVKVGINYARTAGRWAGWITAAVAGGVLARFGDGAFETGRELLNKVLSG